MFHTSLRSQLKNSCFVFHQGFQTPRTIKQLRLQRRAFICFSVFGTPDEKLAFVSSFVVTDIVGFVCLLKNKEKFTPRIQPLYIRRSTYRILNDRATMYIHKRRNHHPVESVEMTDVMRLPVKLHQV